MTRFAFFLLAAISLSAAPQPLLHDWKTIKLDNHFWAEGAAFGDINKDGVVDVIAGPYWYEGPSFQKRHAYYPDKETFKKKLADGKEQTLPGFEGALGENNNYSDNFFAFTYDFNGDGWLDIMIYGFPGKEATWYENPGKAGLGKDAPWSKHKVFDVVDNESPWFIDVNGDGKPDILCNSGGYFGYATADWSHPEKPWTFHPISEKGDWQRFTHGLGCGDINGDGRLDVLDKDGWWEQPADRNAKGPWKRHAAKLGSGGAQMFVYDVDGDGLNDVITSIEAHGYGLSWFKQVRKNGEITFVEHPILGKQPKDSSYGLVISQMHAIDLIDMDGDGIKDIVTGKRFWAHGSHGDADPGAPAVLEWFKISRGANGQVDFIPFMIDNDSGIGTQVTAGFASNPKFPDVVVSNKKGTFVHLHSTRPVSAKVWKESLPLKTGNP